MTRRPLALAASVPKRPSIGYVPLAATGKGAAKKVLTAASDLSNTHRSLWKQVSDASTGIISGIPKLAATGFKSTPLPMAIHLINDARTGNLGSDAGVQGFMEKYDPLAAQMGTSFQHTAHRLRHPTEYARAVRDGRIVDAVLEDATNASIVAGPAAKLFGAAGEAAEGAGMARTATAFGGAEKAAELVHTVGGKVADSPLSLPRRAINFAREGTFKGINTLADLDAGEVLANPGRGAGLRGVAARYLQPAAETLRDRLPLRLTEEGRTLREGVGEADAATPRARARAQRDLFRDAGVTDSAGAARTAEQGAAIADMNGVADVDRLMRERAAALTPEQVDQIRGDTPFSAKRRPARVGPSREIAPDHFPHLYPGEVRGPTPNFGIDEYTPPVRPAEGGYLPDENWDWYKEKPPAADAAAADGAPSTPVDHMPLTADEVRRIHTLKDIPEQTYTADVADVVRAGQDGTLHPDSQAYIDRVKAAAAKTMGKITERAIEGYGRVKGALDPAQLGDAPIDEYVFKNLEDAGVPSHQIDAVKAARDAGAEWVDLEGKVPELADVLDNPLSYPKAWRVSMRAANLGRAAGIDMPVRPGELLDAGVRKPMYFSSADSDLAQPKRIQLGRERANTGTTGFRGTASENQAISNEVQPYSLRTLGEAAGREAASTTYNAHLMATIEKAGLPKVADFLDPDTLQRIHVDALKEAGAQHITGPAAQRLLGKRIVEELDKHGMSIIEGDPQNPQVGDFNPDSGTMLEHVTADSVILPTGVKNKLVQYWAERGGGIPAHVIDWINKKFKGNVLPFSIRWQVGDMVGGAFMSWVGGGINPVELVASMRQLKDLTPQAREELFNHPDFADASLSQGDAQVIRSGPDAPKPKTPIGKLKQASFKFNHGINTLNRHAYLLAKTDELLTKHGLSVDRLGSDTAAWHRPEVQEAITAAVHDAQHVMGTFDEMTPFEQRVMKRVFPFWAWNRHITQLAFNTLIDNPARMAWTLRLGSYGTDPDADMPAWMAGSIGFGSKLIPTNFANPFNDVAGGAPIYTGSGALKAMSPAIKLTAAAAGGWDFNNGGAQFSRPGGNQTKGLHPMFAEPAQLAYQAAQSFPLARVGLSVAPDGNVDGIGLGPHPRYGTGQTIVDKATGKPIATDSRATKAASLFGVPLPTDKADAAAIVAGNPSTNLGPHLNKVKLTATKTKKVKLR